MLKSKHGLLAAVFTLAAMPLAGVGIAADTEGAAHAANPALPSQDDLIRFDDSSPAQPALLDPSGANQRAFPLFYGAPAAATGTLIAAAPGVSAAPASPAAVTPGDAARAHQSHGGTMVGTYTAVPVPVTDPVREGAFVDYDAYLARKRDGDSGTAPARPESKTDEKTADKTDVSASSVASVRPHADAGGVPDTPPTLGAKVNADASPAATKPAESVAPAAIAAATPGGKANEPAAAPQKTTEEPAPALRPVAQAKPSVADERAAALAQPAAGAEPSPPHIDTESHFPAASIVPPPIPGEPALASGLADSHPTVGLAEFRTGAALDGTPLPPPPPMPELPGRQDEPEEIQIPVLPTIDAAQVRADFNRLKAFCEEDSLGSAAEIYSRMPDFGDNEEINRLRADAANLLILGLARTDNLRAARRIFDSVPVEMPGYDANLAKTRGVINLATYYVRSESYNDAFDVLMDLKKLENRSALNNELFRLMARMIPYLDNADETEKAQVVYDMLLAEVRSPGTASLFAENIQGVLKYFLHYVDRSENPLARRRRMDFIEHMYSSLERLKDDPEIRMVRRVVGMSLAERYAGDPDRAAKFME